MRGLFTAVAARLSDKERCPALLRAQAAINGADAMEMLALSLFASAVVYPISDTASRIREAGLRVTQTEGWLFGVMLSLVAPAGFERFEDARDQIKDALCGWCPEGAATPVEYDGGQTLQYSLGKDGGRWLYLLRFRLSTQRTYEVQP